MSLELKGAKAITIEDLRLLITKLPPPPDDIELLVRSVHDIPSNLAERLDAGTSAIPFYLCSIPIVQLGAMPYGMIIIHNLTKERKLTIHSTPEERSACFEFCTFVKQDQ